MENVADKCIFCIDDDEDINNIFGQNMNDDCWWRKAYVNKTPDNPSYMIDILINDDADDPFGYIGFDFPINFCPMCGRLLKKEE